MVESLYKPSRTTPSLFQIDKQEVISPGALNLMRNIKFCVFPCTNNTKIIVVVRFVWDVSTGITVMAVYKKW